MFPFFLRCLRCLFGPSMAFLLSFCRTIFLLPLVISLASSNNLHNVNKPAQQKSIILFMPPYFQDVGHHRFYNFLSHVALGKFGHFIIFLSLFYCPFNKDSLNCLLLISFQVSYYGRSIQQPVYYTQLDSWDLT